MPDRLINPVGVKLLGNIDLDTGPESSQQFVSRIIERALRADHNRMGWLNRQRTLTRLRFGIRRPKSFPWKNASNISVPLIDAQIRRFKPILMRLIVESDPIVEFVGEDADAVAAERTAEAEFNWLWRTHMNATEPMAYVVDTMCHRGFAIAQVAWDYQVEYETRVCQTSDILPPDPRTGQPSPPPQDPNQIIGLLADQYDLSQDDPRVAASLKAAAAQIIKGAPFVRLDFKRVITDRPAVFDRDPVQVLVPPRTTDYANAEWIVVQHIFSVRKLQQMEANGYFIPGSVEKAVGDLTPGRIGQNSIVGDTPLSSIGSGMAQERLLQDEKERIWGMESEDEVMVWQVFAWKDINNDGLAERVELFIHPRSRQVLSSRPYAYPFHRWPFVRFDFEKTSRRYHSPRGISGMLEGLQREANHQHNARLDAMTLHNAPIYQIPLLAGFKARNFRATPGTVLQLPVGAELKPVMQDRGSFTESVNEENLLRQLAETYIGAFDNAVTSAGSQNARRTATEINAATQLAASTASLDTILFQLSMKELYELVWELWIDLRPEEVSYKVLGQDPKTAQPLLVTVKKSEIAKKFKLTPTGTIANTNRALELSNAKEALQYFVNDQTGFINPFELRNWYFRLLDYRQARRIMNAPDQAQELQTLRQAAATLQQQPGLLAQMGGQGQFPPAQQPQQEIAEAPQP